MDEFDDCGIPLELAYGKRSGDFRSITLALERQSRDDECVYVGSRVAELLRGQPSFTFPSFEARFEKHCGRLSLQLLAGGQAWLAAQSAAERKHLALCSQAPSGACPPKHKL